MIATAGLREAMCRFISEAKVPDVTMLVVGQRPFDSSQIVAGGFLDALPVASEIHAIYPQYRAVIRKPHPRDKTHSLLAAAAPARVLGVITDNLYRIMALPPLGAVLTVNSSVAHEAPYFGKRLHTLAPLPIRLGWRGAGAQAPCLAGRRGTDAGFLAHRAGAACVGDQAGRDAAAAEAEPPAHCVR